MKGANLNLSFLYKNIKKSSNAETYLKYVNLRNEQIAQLF